MVPSYYSGAKIDAAQSVTAQGGDCKSTQSVFGLPGMVRCRHLPEATKTMPSIQIDREPTELYKILKFEGLASSGGEAKQVIADGQVKVNGELETRKRRKIVVGDRIAYQGQEYSIERT